MTEIELLNERITRMAVNAVNLAESHKKLLTLINELHDTQHASNLKFCKMGEETVVILKQLDDKTSLLEGRTVALIQRMDKLDG